MRFFNKLLGSIIKNSQQDYEGELNHNRILEDCNYVRQMLCQKLLLAAKIPKERNSAEKLLNEAKTAREFIPIIIAKRRLYNL